MPSSSTYRGRSGNDKPSTVRRVPHDGMAWVVGEREPPLTKLTIGERVAQAAHRHPEGEAAVFCDTDRRWTYAELAARADGLAAGLLAIGLYRGDRVAIWLPNRSEWLLTQIATARIGAVLVNVNPAYRLAELEFALNNVQAVALITATSFKSSHYVDMVKSLAPEIDRCSPGRLRSSKLPHLRHVITMGDAAHDGMHRFSDVLARGRGGHLARVASLAAMLRSDDAINIQFTSGTTGTPKGATLTHDNIVNNARMSAHAMRMTKRDRLCIPVPLYHCFGMVLGNLVCIAAAGTKVFPGEGFDAGETLRALHDERCTAVHGVPTMFVAMLNHPQFNNYDLRTLRTGIMAGAPCPEPLMRQVMEDMHLEELTIAYGMTETSPVSFQTAPDDGLQKRVSTVGRIQPHVEAKIIDDDGNLYRVGDQGELYTRGYLVMRSYWGDPARTRQAIDDQGWMHTGDLAVLDRDGYCRIVGRVTDMIIRGGENVYPREIEEWLMRHADIVDAQVFGIPDDRLGELVCAYMIARPGTNLTAEKVKAYCDGQIAHFKIPTHVRLVDAMPMTVTGKPQKFVMREEMLALLG